MCTRQELSSRIFRTSRDDGTGLTLYQDTLGGSAAIEEPQASTPRECSLPLIQTNYEARGNKFTA